MNALLNSLSGNQKVNSQQPTDPNINLYNTQKLSFEFMN